MKRKSEWCFLNIVGGGQYLKLVTGVLPGVYFVISQHG